jgi:putative oxidoreductase
MNKENALNLALLILRVALGVIMALHGAQKVFGVLGGSGIEPFSEMIKGLGFAPPVVWAWVVALSEFIFGIFLVLGIVPRISASVIAVIMAVAIIKVHGPNGFFMSKNGYEYQLLLMASCICLILNGSGKMSILDRF